MRKQNRNCLRREVLRGGLEAQEVFGQSHDVLGAFAQRGHAQLELAEAVEKVFAEAAFFDGGFEILVRSGHDAHIDFDLAMTA